MQEYVYHKQNLSALWYIGPPCQRSILLTAQFWRTRERFCMNRERSLLSMRYLFLGYSLKPRPNSRAFDAVSYSGLSYNHRFYQRTDARTRKSTLKRTNTIDLPTSSSFGNFKGWTRFWRSLSSIEKTKAGSVRMVVERWCYTRRFPTTTFSATQPCDIGLNGYNIVSTLQGRVTLKIVVSNRLV